MTKNMTKNQMNGLLCGHERHLTPNEVHPNSASSRREKSSSGNEPHQWAIISGDQRMN